MEKIASCICFGFFAAFALCCNAGEIDSTPGASRVAFTGFAPVAPHPRLFADDAEFAAAKARISSCEEGRAALAVLMRTADAALSEKPLERKMIGRRLLRVSRSALERIGCLAFAWRYTGDLRYAERAAGEARAVCAFSDWNPGHFLDVGEMTLAAALARDWLDGFLPDDDKRAISSAILRKGLTAGDGRTLPDGWWVKCGNNWNQVCNGGLSAGAAAVRDEFPEIAQAILLRARNALPFALKAYAGGNFPEGPGYWEYATDYTAIALDVMERQFADGAPELFASDGLADQVDYIDCMTGPTGFLFNYSDPFANPFTRRLPIASCWYLARRFGRYGALEAHERPLVRAGFGAGRMLPFLLLWLSEPSSGSSADSPLCRVLGGENPAVVDLTPLYPDAKKVVRKFVLDADGLKVEDRVHGLRPGTVVTWNMNTPARAIASGGRLVLETEDPHGALRRMELAAGPAGVAWECESIAEPRTVADSPNPGMTRVRLRSTAGADGAVEFSVSFRLIDGSGYCRESNWKSWIWK